VFHNLIRAIKGELMFPPAPLPTYQAKGSQNGKGKEDRAGCHR
jgi:hypothetical protein